MPWLLRDEEVLASLEIADTARGRRKGLLGRDGIEGALLIAPAKSVHTLRMRFAIDVAHVDAEGTVLRVCTMRPNRVGGFVRGAYGVIEAEAGAFDRWRLQPGDVVEWVETSEQP